jgi:hypothetical protein
LQEEFLALVPFMLSVPALGGGKGIDPLLFLAPALLTAVQDNEECVVWCHEAGVTARGLPLILSFRDGGISSSQLCSLSELLRTFLLSPEAPEGRGPHSPSAAVGRNLEDLLAFAPHLAKSVASARKGSQVADFVDLLFALGTVLCLLLAWFSQQTKESVRLLKYDQDALRSFWTMSSELFSVENDDAEVLGDLLPLAIGLLDDCRSNGVHSI